MGGFGSGYYGDGSKSKVGVEQCRKIDIRRWQREGLLKRSFVWSWFDDSGEVKASINVIPKNDFLVLSYRANNEPVEIHVPYDETVTGFGVRKWFLCPSCGERCAVLYLKGKYFACRKCHNLNYRSSQLSGDTAYYHRQLEKLCGKLKAEYEPLSNYAPYKPKNMHWATYWKHAKRYRQLAEKRDQLFLTGAMRILNR